MGTRRSRPFSTVTAPGEDWHKKEGKGFHVSSYRRRAEEGGDKGEGCTAANRLGLAVGEKG